MSELRAAIIGLGLCLVVIILMFIQGEISTPAVTPADSVCESHTGYVTLREAYRCFRQFEAGR